MTPRTARLKPRLDALAARYERPRFVQDDPIAVPHAYDDPADRAVIGLYAALLMISLPIGAIGLIKARFSPLVVKRPKHTTLGSGPKADSSVTRD